METKKENSIDLSSKLNNELSSETNQNEFKDSKDFNKENKNSKANSNKNDSSLEFNSKNINKDQIKKDPVPSLSNLEKSHLKSLENTDFKKNSSLADTEKVLEKKMENVKIASHLIKRNSLNIENNDLIKEQNSIKINKVLTDSVESLSSSSSSTSKSSKKKKKNKKNKQEINVTRDDKIVQEKEIKKQKLIENVPEKIIKKSEENNEKKNEQKKEEKIPELLLKENNRSNKNKLFIISLLCLKFVLSFIAQIITLFTPDKKHELPAINEPLLLLSASEITERIKNGQLKCEQIIRAYIKRIEDVQPKLNAMIDNCFEDAIKQAKEIDEKLKDKNLAQSLKKLPLLGVPFTCKDSISVKGLAFTSGVKIRKGIKAEKDAKVIKNLKDAGAIILGMTNTPEIVLWWDTDNKIYGRTNNPYDLSRIPGGSSGGEGALIAAAGSVIGVGSDILGSIRIPSMFNGIFGHKTVKKYVPIDGMFPEHPPTFDDFVCYGPICRYARDLPLMFKAMSGGQADELRLDDPVDFSKIKIYYMEWDGGNPLTSFVDRQIVSKIRQTVKYFETQYNAKSEKISINKFQFSLMYFGSRCTDKENRVEKLVTKDGKINIVFEMMKSIFGKSDITLPILIQTINQNMPVCNPESKTHEKFKKMLIDLKPKVHDLLKENAVLFYPTWPTLAPKHKTTILKGFDATYTGIFNVLELPATHCATGLSKEGLPTGFTVATGINQDRLSIAFAKEIEKIYNGWCPPN